MSALMRKSLTDLTRRKARTFFTVLTLSLAVDVAMEDPPARKVGEPRPHRELAEGRNACRVLVVAHGDRLPVHRDDLIDVDVDVKRVPGAAGVTNDPLLRGIEPDDRVVTGPVKGLVIDPETAVRGNGRKRSVLEGEPALRSDVSSGEVLDRQQRRRQWLRGHGSPSTTRVARVASFWVVSPVEKGRVRNA